MIEGWLNNRCTVTTADATVTTLWIMTLDDETAYLIETEVLTQKTDGSARAMYWKRALVYRDAAGNALILGATQDIAPDIESVGGWDCTIDVSGQSARVRVTGAAATDLIWLGQIRYMKIVGTV